MPMMPKEDFAGATIYTGIRGEYHWLTSNGRIRNHRTPRSDSGCTEGIMILRSLRKSIRQSGGWGKLASRDCPMAGVIREHDGGRVGVSV